MFGAPNIWDNVRLFRHVEKVRTRDMKLSYLGLVVEWLWRPPHTREIRGSIPRGPNFAKVASFESCVPTQAKLGQQIRESEFGAPFSVRRKSAGSGRATTRPQLPNSLYWSCVLSSEVPQDFGSLMSIRRLHDLESSWFTSEVPQATDDNESSLILYEVRSLFWFWV